MQNKFYLVVLILSTTLISASEPRSPHTETTEEATAQEAAACSVRPPAYQVAQNIIQAGVALGGHRQNWIEESIRLDIILARLSASAPTEAQVEHERK